MAIKWKIALCIFSLFLLKKNTKIESESIQAGQYNWGEFLVIFHVTKNKVIKVSVLLLSRFIALKKLFMINPSHLYVILIIPSRITKAFK